MFKTILFKIALAIWFAGWFPLLMLALPSARLTRRFIVLDAWGVLWLARIIAKIRYEIHGDFMPGAIIASKHMSILEVAILVTHVPGAFFIIKRELMMTPIYGWAFWRMGFVGVNRSRGATNMKRLAGRAAEQIRRGMPLIVFPEGTRTKAGAGTNLKRGLLFIAEIAGIPIQPVGADTGLLWPKRGRMSPGTAHLWLMPALPPTATLDEIASSISVHSA